MRKRKAKGRYYIGTSGYQYEHWRGVLYEPGLPKTKWFSRYAETFDTVEINNTFYNLPAAHTFDSWRNQAPEGFVYSLKFSRYGSHLKRLKDPQDSVDHFVERAARLDSFLGPILVQLPPHWHADKQRLVGFLDAVPHRYRWAMEFRDDDWLKDEILEILHKHRVALCIHDMLGGHPRTITADWTYLRFHGDNYRGSYSPQFLSARADEMVDWLEDGLDVYAYFNNDADGHAVRNALSLKRLLSRRLKA